MSHSLWTLRYGKAARQAFDRSIKIDDAGVCTDPGTAGVAIQLVPIRPRRRAIGALLVPDGLQLDVVQNGYPLGGGLYPLCNTDQVEIGGNSYWVAIESSVEFSTYQPSQHGEDVFCFMTKTRLSDGQPIAICPGTASKQCGVIYKREAWQLAVEGTMPRCPNCGYDPKATAWQPPMPKQQGTLPRLLEMISSARAGGIVS